MDANPVLKPKLATPALVLTSVAVGVCVVYLAGSVAANWPPNFFLLLSAAFFVLAGTVTGSVWLVRARRRRTWMAGAIQKWNHFDDVKRTSGTTTDVTVLSVDALEPTGSWITIKWNRFDHVQTAWLEAMHDPIWPGTVLLVAPDSGQVMPGEPWPPAYFIRSSHFLAWAPSAAQRPSSYRKLLSANQRAARRR
ncbi:hypothetical protein ABIB45_001741 [Arthrobacter sp. UYCo732]